eukprot:m.487006 g.487006  ORF g.487006 m.487006 type:complete len:523 (+) comp24735_c0_seq1:84-1652(+)
MAPLQVLVLAAVVLVAVTAALAETANRPPNILYLMSDDMRPQLEPYGHEYMKTPYLKSLAESGLLFSFAYTQFAYCAPSRNSFLSGRRPDRTKCLNFLHKFRDYHPEWTAMPEFFKNHGYFTSSAGKIYHDGMDDPKSWSYPSNQTHWIMCQKGDINEPLGNYCGVTNKSKIPYTDEDLAIAEGLKRLDLAKASGKPWWVSIGFHRPHTHYRVPEGFYPDTLYPTDEVKPPKHPSAPIGAPFMSGNWHGGDIHDPAHGCPTCFVPANRSVQYRRWYYAAVTWSDYNVGKALKKLEEMGEVNNTIVIHHADHGYQLGEGNEWSKKTDTELATHVPMIIRVPWKQAAIGKKTAVKAELIDLYRTLVDLTGLPSADIEEDVQGESLAAVFDNPETLPAALADKVAFSQIGRCACHNYTGPNYNSTRECGAGACVRTLVADFDFIGYSIRNHDWRYTAWLKFSDKVKRTMDWEHIGAEELYDLTTDDGTNFDYDGYNINVVDNPAHAAIVTSLRAKLKTAVESWKE